MLDIQVIVKYYLWSRTYIFDMIIDHVYGKTECCCRVYLKFVGKF